MIPPNKDKNPEQLLCDNISLSAFNKLQAYGVVLVVDRQNLQIIQYSENMESLFKTSALNMQTKLITDFLTFQHPNGDVREWLMQSDKQYGQFIWNETDNPQNILLYIHQQNNVIILEIEVMDDKYLTKSVFSLLNEMVNINLDESSQDMAIIANVICQNIQRITGYDRVILYQFQEDNTGVVLGEAITNEMESYLGLHFPDTDIPRYVREMYLQQPLRYIPNIDYTPVSLLSTQPTDSNHTLDLTNVMLRAVSPMHIEYLNNMGVKSAMSVAIIYNNKLWGLIGCQHKTAKNISLYYRFALVLLAKLIIRQLITIDTNKHYIAQNTISHMIVKIQDTIYSAKNSFLLFENIKDDVMKMLSADGIVFLYQNQIVAAGSIPTENQITDLVNWLVDTHRSQSFVTHHLITEYPLSKEYSHLASGLLALPLTPKVKNYLLLFRKEVVADIVWAGDPSHVLTQKEESYSPRNSFKMWKEKVKNHSISWMQYEIDAAKLFQTTLLTKLLQFLFDEREEQHRHVVLMQEMQVKLEQEVSKRTEELHKSNEGLKEAIIQLQTIKDTVIKNENMAIVGQLAAGMAHEINNPLSFLISNIDYLQKQNNKATPIKDLDTILSESKEGLLRIKNIVSNLVIFSSRNSANDDLIDINEALKSAIELTRSAWNGKSVVTEHFSEIPRISASLSQLELLFVNFILNAAQSISTHGEITISTAISESSILISFKDNGCGISPQNMSKLFLPFFTTKPKNESLGLGLAVNYGIVDALGGKITVESELGSGTTFTVHLPRWRRPAA